MACIIWRIRAEGSSSLETTTDGLSARRDEARTSLTASPSVLLIFSSRVELLGFIGLGVFLEAFGGRGPVDGLEIDVAILGDGREDDIVVEQKDLDALLLVDLEQGRVAKHQLGATSDVVERLLLGLPAGPCLGERGEAFA